MNSNELTLSAINGIPEKIPFNPFIMHLAASLQNVNYAKIYCQDAEILADAQIQCAKFFGIDHVNVSTDAYREASAWGVELSFEGHTPVAKAGGYLNWREFDSIDEPDLLTSPRVQNRVEAVRLLRKKAPDQCVVGWIEAPFAELCCLFDMVETIKIWMQKDWEYIFKNLLNRILPNQFEFAKLQIEAGADMIGAGDSAISQIGPKRYKMTTLSATQELFRSIAQYVPVLYHVCGDNARVDKEGNDMLKLIASSGASVVDLDFQVDLAAAKEKVGHQICLRGNTDTILLGNRYSSKDQVTEAIKKTVTAGKPNGKYMFGAGCEWPWEPKDLAIRNLSIAKVLVEQLGKY
ncbi:MAG: uroporphyrinogen decarboxylase family protein [Candidatus Helarchaeota archaeon]|nr:uroporphyrinogen decarboxylase family protein [Candidatus Helarchaeota archaeon]